MANCTGLQNQHRWFDSICRLQNNNMSYSADYIKIRKEAMKWPNWQKQYYNEIFATSKNAKKIPYNSKQKTCINKVNKELK